MTLPHDPVPLTAEDQDEPARDPALSDPERHYPYAAGMLEERLRSLLDALDKADAETDDYWRERALQQLASERALSRNAIRRVLDGAKAMRGGR